MKIFYLTFFLLFFGCVVTNPSDSIKYDVQVNLDQNYSLLIDKINFDEVNLNKINFNEFNLDDLNIDFNLDFLDLDFSAITVSGQFVLPNKEDYFRLILVDDKDEEHLIFEAYYPLFDTSEVNFDSVCNETCDLKKINPKKIKIETNISDFSKINISSLNLVSGKQVPQKSSNVQRINKILEKNNDNWVANETELSKLSYAEKKSLFGSGDYFPPGLEYYSQGIYGFFFGEKVIDNLPKSWDWRNVNGKNYVSEIKFQGSTGYCWVFSSTSLVESLFKIKYDKTVSLAEKEFMCGEFENKYLIDNKTISSPTNKLIDSKVFQGGYVLSALNYLKYYGAINESCLKFNNDFSRIDFCKDAVSNNCLNFNFVNGLCADLNCFVCKNKTFLNSPNLNCEINENYKIKEVHPIKDNLFGDSFDFSNESDVKLFKKTLIEQGPLTISTNLSNYISPTGLAFNYDQTHAMLVVGYQTTNDGKLILILKNSWGKNWGENGFIRVFPPKDVHSIYYAKDPFIENLELEQTCEDKDKDGYCYWNLLDKPSSCPDYCSNKKDCDDFNPNSLYFNEDYRCVYSDEKIVELNEESYEVINFEKTPDINLSFISSSVFLESDLNSNPELKNVVEKNEFNIIDNLFSIILFAIIFFLILVIIYTVHKNSN
jgi:C1A family cysteine protease